MVIRQERGREREPILRLARLLAELIGTHLFCEEVIANAVEKGAGLLRHGLLLGRRYSPQRPGAGVADSRPLGNVSLGATAPIPPYS